tara:strand:- start:124 stop:309 length:186 start_codon:yes stop_codon:yes gene_type:complete
MQLRLKTRRRPYLGILTLLGKIAIPIVIFFVIIFFASKIEISAPSKIIKHKISNEQFKIIK